MQRMLKMMTIITKLNKKTTTSRTDQMMTKIKKITMINQTKSNKAQMEKMTTKIQANNFRTMTIHDTLLKIFRLNSKHLARKHSKRKSKPTPKDC